MKYRLIHLSGSLEGRGRDVDAGEIVLGRDPDAAQVVFGASDRQVSRRHASLTDEGGVLLLRDLGSSTGTFVEGNDVEEAELRHGDVFELGRGGPRLRVEFGDGGTVVVPVAELVPGAGPRLPRPVPAVKGGKLRLSHLGGERAGTSVVMTGALCRLGRAPGSTVAFPSEATVSAQHAKIVSLDGGFVLIDLESRNGTFVNGQRVERTPLASGDVIRLGPIGPSLSALILAPERDAQTTIVIPNFADLAARRSTGVMVQQVVLATDSISVGRGVDSELRLDSPIVSKAHARFVRDPDGSVRIDDLGSSNGTYLEGARIERATLRPGARVVIGPFQIVLGDTTPPTLRVLDTRNRARLDARGLTVQAGARLILDDVSLSFPPGSFTALIGPSGAGKSTLLSALNAARPATRGQVLLNGVDVYQAFDSLKATLGYVPQDDIVHRELTVGQSLEYTARLRLPRDTTPEERERRIAEVLATLELTERRATPIHRLSGGQRKRVSIAAELLTEPNLIFLDEPTSGLDPGLEESLMLLLRELSYKGKTVVLVTHTLDNIHLCDGIVLLVDGRLACYGSAAELRDHFEIEHVVNLYARLKQRTPQEWQALYRSTAQYAARIEQPLASLPAPAPTAAATQPTRSTGSWRQLRILTARYLETLITDRKNAALLIAQAPLIACLIGLSLLYGESDIAYTKPKNTILFLLALTAVWFGCSNAARELVKERAIYLRERMVNLRVFPYVVSKLAVLLGIALVQCVLFLLILDSWFVIPGNWGLLLASMTLASLVGILLGLTLSALVSTADRAMTLLPILLIPQVLFTSPAVQMDMQGPAGLLARGMPTWWSYDLLRRVALAPGAALDDDAVETLLKAGGPVLMTKPRFESMLQQGYPMFQYRGAIEITWTAALPDTLAAALPERLRPWRPALVDTLALAGFGAAFLGAATLLQRGFDRRT